MSLNSSAAATDSAQDFAVAASGLAKRFGTREVVSDLSFTVARGHAFGLLGPNGAGKTTTVRLLTGLLNSDSGEASLFGEPVTPSSADVLRSRIGVQTDTNLYETLTARENLRTWGALYAIAPKHLERRIDEVLDVLGLSERDHCLVGEFSKGMRQKLAVGRAIIHEPELLFLDEPTAGLDPEAAADLLDYLRQMIQYLNTTVFICTHQLHGLETLCDSVGIIKQGRLLVSGPVDQLLHKRWPQQQYTVSISGNVHRAQQVAAAVPGAAVSSLNDDEFAFLSQGEQAPSEVVTALVHAGISVRTVVPHLPTIEEFYFATLGEGEGA